ncbi:hypothetical protein GGG17_07135 [Arsenicicoccus sp. MKL-02]|uniref:Phytase-like domain-containing protein n=1 Tax=Arsenicicoccus cauae TaxID=2663847 RepID=A0A6I3IDF2_9MICO|nr:esterase-like activity of phytase family protein [Arsenicicoccus cauae]MTB71747.1 hypothetical protein [Arsenicicoccus cauae]
MRRLATTVLALALAAAAALPATAATAGPDSAGPDHRGKGRGPSHDRPLPHASAAQLTGWSVLPTETYVPGSEPSGRWVTGNAAVPAPFKGQPVQGFSATHRSTDGSYLVMSDNGFGTKANSADALLAVHRIKPDTRTGRTRYLGTPMQLSDPGRLVPWPIWRDGACLAATSLPQGYTCPTPDRRLTGWDFDPESMQIAPDGTFWFGDEFGPYLLHTDARGRLLQAPIPTPGVKSPSNPTLKPGEAPQVPDSKGYEGMAISPDGLTLYPLLEGATAEDKAAGHPEDLRIHTVRLGGRAGARYTGEVVRYRMEDKAHAIGDFAMINDHQGMVIERDGGAGPTAQVKRVYLVDLRDRDNDGYVEKHLLVDLMDLANPRQLGGAGDPFTFPFVTIEDVEILDARTIAVMNDNNFPGTGGRSATQPDRNEYLEIRLGGRLDVDKRLLPTR